jgi:hypothetical protein
MRLLWFRVALLSLGGLLGLVLITRGAVLIGVIILAMALLFSVGSATAEEQRCTDLGSACICSEPLNTNSYQNTAMHSSVM